MIKKLIYLDRYVHLIISAHIQFFVKQISFSLTICNFPVYSMVGRINERCSHRCIVLQRGKFLSYYLHNCNFSMVSISEEIMCYCSFQVLERLYQMRDHWWSVALSLLFCLVLWSVFQPSFFSLVSLCLWTLVHQSLYPTSNCKTFIY